MRTPDAIETRSILAITDLRNTFDDLIAAIIRYGNGPKALSMRIATEAIRFFIKTRDAILTSVAWVARIAIAIRDTALWLYHFPWRCILMLKLMIRRLVSLALFTGKIALFATLGLLAVLAACIAIRAVYRTYRSHKRRLYLRQVEQERKRNYDALCQKWEQERQQSLQRAQQAEEVRRQRETERRQRKERARRQTENARQQRQEQQKRHDAAFREHRRLEDLKLYNRWRTYCDEVFTASAGDLPEPPSWPCSQPECQLERHLKACRHSIERLFSATGNLQRTLSEERDRWHPNRAVFYRLQRRDGSVKMATEISQVIQSLLR